MTARQAIAVGAILGAGGLAVCLGLRQRRPPEAPAQTAQPDTGQQACAERLARLGKALRLYASDYDGHYPVTPTPGDAGMLLPLLEKRGVTAGDFECPGMESVAGLPYAYYSYRDKGSGDWPNWMPERHIVGPDAAPDTWLMGDRIRKDAPGPHSLTDKAFNYLQADGSVQFYAGRPRDVFR